MKKTHRYEEAWRLRYLTAYNAEYWRLELEVQKRIVSRLEIGIALAGIIATGLSLYKWFEFARPLLVGATGFVAQKIIPKVCSEKVKECERLSFTWSQFESEVDELWRLGNSTGWGGHHTLGTLLRYVERERQYAAMERWKYDDKLRARAHELADKRLGADSNIPKAKPNPTHTDTSATTSATRATPSQT